MRSKQKKDKIKRKGLRAINKIIIVAIFTLCVSVVINLAPNYIQKKYGNKTNIIINNTNVTNSLKKDIKFNEDGAIYISFEDIKNFFDENIYFDSKYNKIITTSDTKVAAIGIGEKEINVNGSKVNIHSKAVKDDDTYYIPISEMTDVFNIEIKYSEKSDIVTIDSLNREQRMGNSSKNTNVKYKPTIFSKTVDKVIKGESVVVINEIDGWYKVRTSSGNIGYLKDVVNIYKSRENIEREKQIEGKVSMAWDYFPVSVPKRTESYKGINVVSPSFASLTRLGKGKLDTRIGDAGVAYINWAHNNGYKVWPLVSNESQPETTSEILNDYQLRQDLINNILDLALQYNWDGVNIDFEYLKKSDKEMLTQFIIELAPRLAEYEKVLSIDVTAPDGGEQWSMCYDRHKLSQVADYIIFMAYDQHNDSSEKAGPTAGADWIEANLKKFVGTQEEVDSNKLILAMPFYARLWKENGEKLSSQVIYMKSINSNIPTSAERTWKDDDKMYYTEFDSNGTKCKMWLEEQDSIRAKFDLMNKYKLAGAAYWQLGFETPDIWEIVETEINR